MAIKYLHWTINIMINPISSLKSPIEIKLNSAYSSNPIKAKGLTADVFERTVSNISFTSVDDTKHGKAIRELGGVPCPYTGVPMINGKEISHLNKNNLSGSSKVAIALLKPFEDRMQPVEKQVFHILEDLSKREPKKDLRQLLDKVRPDHLEAIKQQEFDILNRMSKIKLQDKQNKEDMNNLLLESMGIIEKQDANYIFRRRRFLKKLDIITSKMKNEINIDKIKTLADEIPRAHDNMSSFIVKFTQKDPGKKKERTAYQIGIALVNSAVGSIEHVHPRTPLDGTAPGKDDISNYIYASRVANTTRKNMPFDKWVEKNPKIKDYMQMYMDAVIDKVNNGAMKGFKAYPIIIAKTIEKESKGQIKLDTSKLKIKKSEISEAFREYGIGKTQQKSSTPYKKLDFVA